MTEHIRIASNGSPGYADIEIEAIEAVLREYDLGGSTYELISSSENSIYRVKPRAGPSGILRVHRFGHRAKSAILSEIAWTQALRQEAGVSTPLVIANREGLLATEIDTSLGPTHCVLFEELGGGKPPDKELTGWFRRLGTLCARIHRHSRSWRPPTSFARPVLDWQSLIGPTAVWGPWTAAPGLDPRVVPVLSRLADILGERTRRYGNSADRFGLIHGDLRLQNLLVEGEDVHIIDFDDCGTSWFLYDLATAISLLEDLPVAHDLVDAWIEGYRALLPLTREDIEVIPTLIMMRRLQILSWFGSRAESELAQQWVSEYVPGAVSAAEDYLSGRPRLRPSR
jgi:Ser/Thr protein kinase RdoA (MazF antagonist)